MFNSKKGGAAASAPDPATLRARKAMAASLLGPDLVFEGALSGAGEVHVDGRIVGDVKVGRLVVGEVGAIEGVVEAESVDVRGRVIGSITADRVRIAATAHVEADIVHRQLSMEVGAFFEGRCTQAAEGEAAPSLALLAQPPADRPAAAEPAAGVTA